MCISYKLTVMEELVWVGVGSLVTESCNVVVKLNQVR